ncbi:MAG: hydroxyacylglutathione hydrolase [Agarilytica sp.]
MIEVSAIPILHDNYVWALHAPDGSKEVCVIDPGDPQPVIEFLADGNFALKKILITHSHNDHIGGISTLLDKWQVPVVGPKCAAIPQVTETVAGGDCFFLWDALVQVLGLPGHLPEHLGYVVEYKDKKQIFSGDVLFSSGCGRIFEGSHAELKSSLDKVADHPDDTLIYGTHEYTAANLKFAREVEPDNDYMRKRAISVAELRADHLPTLPTTLALEKKVNPFLRCKDPAVIEAITLQLGREPIDELEVFTSLRAWKDMF